MNMEATSRKHQDAVEAEGTLDEIRLMPGDTLQLQQLIEGQDERLNVRLIGVMKPISVMVTAPVIDGKLIFVREARPFLARAFSGMNVCAFKTKVLKAQHTPFSYIHLAYPDKVQILRIRKSIRASVQLITAIYDREGGRQVASGRIIDLSVGGARIHSQQPLGEKTQRLFLAFKIRLDGDEHYIQTASIIRTINQEFDADGKLVFVTGIQFEELQQAERLMVMNLVYQYLLKENE